MKKIIISLAILLTCISTSFAQYLEVSDAISISRSKKVTTTEIVKDGESLKTIVADSDASTPTSTKLTVVQFTAEEIPKVSITDIRREDVSHKWLKLDDKTWVTKEAGKYWFDAETTGYGKLDPDTGRITIFNFNSKLIVEVGAQPVDPDINPIDPDIEPDVEPDVDPTPDPDAVINPIKIDGNSLLIVLESQLRPTLPEAQQAVLNSETVRMYLNSVTAKDAQGNSQWRIFDPDTVFPSNTTNPFKAALERPRTSDPWIIISTKTGGYEGRLPENVSDMMELLKKYFN